MKLPTNLMNSSNGTSAEHESEETEDPTTDGAPVQSPRVQKFHGIQTLFPRHGVSGTVRGE
jgi:hypothetical protein